MKYYATLLNENGNIAVDDTLLVKGSETTAGSGILKGFEPLFSAEAVTRLEKAGYVVSGKTHVGEFGLDLVGEFSAYSEKNDLLKGAAPSLIEEGKIKGALGVDVNGAPRRAAAISNIAFIKPTYGTVSRYGVVSTAASGEQVGVYSADADGIKEILEVISGHDEKDGTSLKEQSYSYDTDVNLKGKKVCIIKELLEKADEQTQQKVKDFAEKLALQGVSVEEISTDLFETANIAWQILMSAETCNNISRYDGVKYGHRSSNYRNIDELYVNSRTEGFNFLTKATILYGSDVLSKNRYKECYDKSLRVRRIVSDNFKKLMETYDAVLTPVCSKASFEKYDIESAFEKVFAEGEFTSIANLIGVPAVVSSGVQILGDYFNESILLSIAKVAERKGE